MRSERFNFPNGKGEQLAATLDLPLGKPTALRAVRALLHLWQGQLGRQAHRRAAGDHGIAVLRFDFTGLGSSEGEFANTHFSSNVDDLVAAADHLRKMYWRAGDPHRPQPRRRRGARGFAPHCRRACVVTIAAPYDPAHVTGLFKQHIDTIKRTGRGGSGAGRAAVPY